MLYLLAIILVAAFSIPAESATDYCAICSNHIACNNSGVMACAGKIDSFNATEKQMFVNEHNRLRNQIASGQQAGFPTAKRMATMVWNDELAALAVLNVNQCAMKHDACRNTAVFKFAGQNLWKGMSKGYPREALVTAVPKYIQSWYSEYSAALASDIAAYPSSTGGRVIGHFTQVVKDRATQVGCAINRYVDAAGWDNVLLACNYARTNMIGEPTYVSGTKASGCITGVNPAFPALCSINESITP